MTDDDDPLRDARSALASLTQLLAASVAASLARAGGVLGPRAEARLWPMGVPSPLDVDAMHDALHALPIARRPIDCVSVLDDVLSLMPDRPEPTSLGDLTLQVADLLIHIGRRIERTEDADARFGVAFAVWPCVVEGHFVLATMLATADDERIAATAEPIARAIEELIVLAARCGGTAEA